jgi:hypothetical protein
MTTPRPRYRELPGGDAAGVFGADDALGCLNLLTPERTGRAASLIRTGKVFNLNGSVTDWPNPNPAGYRPPPSHHFIDLVPGMFRDDYLDGFFLQGSTQWDGFLHVADPATGKFYNSAEVDGPGVGAFAERGIAGRAVLLDVARYRARVGRPLDWRSPDAIDVDDLTGCAAAQDVVVDEGTIVLLRVGWEQGYRALSADERADYAAADFSEAPPYPGLEASVEMAELLWNWGVAAIACDNIALEVFPAEVELPDLLHVLLLARLGMPIGEFFLLDELAAECEREQRYEFFLTSAPINLPRGVGSPANALAVM